MPKTKKIKAAVNGPETTTETTKEDKMKIENIYPAKVYRYDENDKPVEVDYELFQLHKNDPVGTLLFHDVAAPGTGTITKKITKIDKTGVYGITIKSTVRELTLADVI